ncbi:MAG: hypothetical protein ABIP95_10600 [Pelobium sp.]
MLKFVLKIGLFIIVGILLNNSLNAQDLAIIYDKDGYTNVRQSASLKSPIIGKIKEGQVFCISPFNDDFKNKDWFAVWFPIKPKHDIKDFIKSEDTKQDGFVHRSRITFLVDLKEIGAEQLSDDKFIFKAQEFELSIATKAYQKKPGTLGDLAMKTDPAQWGSYGVTPRNEFKSISVKTKAGVYYFPKNAFSKLYEINLDQTHVYIGKQKEIYLAVSGADGSDSYDAIWCLKTGKLFSMTVMQTIP